MVSFIVYDLGFLVLFLLFVVLFLYKNKKNTSREGIMFMYKSQKGVKTFDKIAKKYSKLWNSLRYPIIFLGYILMASVLYLFGQAVYIYLRHPEITEVIKAPPIMPLIPYFTQIFNLESIFPNFYFIYFLIAIAVIAIVHEGMHGIYMRMFNVKIKSTGLLFLGPLLGAFVEQDDKDFMKKSKIQQMVVLGAGVFGNVIFALLFFFLMVGFFNVGYAESGYIYNTYAYSILPASMITSLGATTNNLTEVFANNKTYFVDDVLKVQFERNLTHIVLYEDSPALESHLDGIITQIDDIKIRNQRELQEFLQNKNPGDMISVRTFNPGEETYSEVNLTLATHPADKDKAFIGVGSVLSRPSGRLLGVLIFSITKYKNETTFYQEKFSGAGFIYDLLWWVAMINLLVAIFNMLPAGIFDGGRFFYLTILGLTGSEKIAKKSSKLVTYFILLLVLLLLISWLIAL